VGASGLNELTVDAALAAAAPGNDPVLAATVFDLASGGVDEVAAAGARSDGVNVAVDVAGGITELEVAGGAVPCDAGTDETDSVAVTGVRTLDTADADEAAAAGVGYTAPGGVGVGIGVVVDGVDGVAELEEVGGAAACGAGVEDAAGVAAPGVVGMLDACGAEVDADGGVGVDGARDAGGVAVDGGAELDTVGDSDPNLARSIARTTSPKTRNLANGRFHQ